MRLVMMKTLVALAFSVVLSLLTPGWLFSGNVLLGQTPRCFMPGLVYLAPFT